MLKKLWHKMYQPSYPNHPYLVYVKSRILHLIESIGGSKYKSDFEGVHSFCLFIGHGRTGSSLIGSLIDAHPNIIIAHELNPYDSIIEDISKEALFFRLLARSNWFSRKGAEWTGYDYSVPTQHKGKFERLRVIGDKSAGATTKYLSSQKSLIKKIHKTVQIPIKFIHVKRNPLDNISTYSQKSFDEEWSEDVVDKAISHYFDECERVRNIRGDIDNLEYTTWKTVYIEDFVNNTQNELYSVLDFLDEEASREYIADCERKVFNKPNRSREDVEFTKDQTKIIKSNMEKYQTLERYLD